MCQQGIDPVERGDLGKLKGADKSGNVDRCRCGRRRTSHREVLGESMHQGVRPITREAQAVGRGRDSDEGPDELHRKPLATCLACGHLHGRGVSGKM